MITTEEKKAIVSDILQGKDFKGSTIFQNLLTYLLTATLDEKIPKEITIAIDVFGKDSNFNSNKDSTVRYHVHMLRKKLENYYKSEGTKDKNQLVIPKGHYEIKFIRRSIQQPGRRGRVRPDGGGDLEADERRAGRIRSVGGHGLG
jgi:hypothetical protein